ncbi:MAG: ComEC family competence protein, partial [Candidatus Pacebacteria bacterium]|nr:ComEC family competence protein [Candidatus Paceibacterota bacterium]
MTTSKIFLYFCLSFVGGIFISSLIFLSQILLLGFVIIGLILISVLWRYKKIAIFGFCILFLVFGIWRHQNSELQIINSKLQIYNDTNEKITLIGIVSEEPDIKEKVIRLTVEVQELNKEKSNGKLLITTNRYPEYKYGDKLEINGKLKNPSEDLPAGRQGLNGFNYKNYLQKDGIYSVMEWPKIETIGSGFGNPVMEIIYSFKNKFKEVCRKFISPPQLGLLEALVFGDEQNFSQEFKDKLNITGTRHIAAVSGMNITIISSLILNFILLFGLWRKQAFYLAIILLIVYILMIGAPASAVRAGILGGLFMIGQNLGRFSTASRAVVFAATFMLLLNPFLLKLDIGFQLSFLAILGIIFLQPMISSFFQKILP